MSYKRIDNYGIVGNGLTLALIGKDCSVDWMCLPYMDSPSVFAAILDDAKGGVFSVTPVGEWDSVQSYLPRTNILRTLFRTVTGEAEVIDFMPAGPEAEKDDDNRTRLLRRIKGIKGNMNLEITCAPRFNYAQNVPAIIKAGQNFFKFSTEDETVIFFATDGCSLQGEKTPVAISEETTVWLGINYGEHADIPDIKHLENILTSTEQYWVSWVRSQETGKYPLRGFWQETLDRSALVLKLLQFRETGAIAAAASCSLPTIIYGVRNWDYRFSWIRDTSMTLAALFELGHTSEVSLYLDWVKRLATKSGGPNLDVLYKLRKPSPPSGETNLKHLSGYKYSRPVLIGQYNIGQHQHDIHGELLEMIFSISKLVGKIDPEYWQFVRSQVEHVITIWRDKDNGIWELRTGPHHVTHSKVMCWVALDRGIKIAEHYGFPADIEVWKGERDEIHKDVLEKGYNRKRQSFTQHYETEELDAALLQIPLVGFLPADDPRVISTIKAVEAELLVDGLMLRYKSDDGLPGREHGWLICTFWYLRCLIMMKRFEEVRAYLRKIEQYSNHLGLFGEEYDTRFKEITGNFPQAFSHIGYVTTVLEYLEAKRDVKKPTPVSLTNKISLLFKTRLLTPEIPEKDIMNVTEPGLEVKRIMNVLRGQFYDGHQQRVNYHLIRNSDYYMDFQKAVAALKRFDPSALDTNQERIAFWVNVFNALVIHAVIELGIQESVKEVPFFFEQTQYFIGNERYTLSDIEHGILRKNSVPPYRFKKRFSENDTRLANVVEQPDPRVHFALVCASRTCPPIEAYEAGLLDRQMDASAHVFINATTQIDREKKTLSVSKIFKWYDEDFNLSKQDFIKYIAGYLYDSSTGEWLDATSGSIKIFYTPYDWRLNR